MHTLTPEQDLKLYLLAKGVKIDPEAEQAWLRQFGGPMTLNEYASTSGVALYTADGVWINAPFLEAFTQQTEARLVCEGNQFAIVRDSLTVPVSVVPVSAYHQETYEDGGQRFPYTNLGVTHTDRCRISPVEGCAWVCTFCDLPYEFKYRKKPKDELRNVVRMAKNDRLAPARHVLISGGTPKPEDEAWIDEIYAHIAEHAAMPVDVMMPARKDMGYPAWLKSVGVNMLSINLEVFDRERARKITPNKLKLLGLDHYLNYIEVAVKAFGVGFVQSLIVFGSAIEPIESTLEGVRELARRGCMPVLSPFRPDPVTPLGKKGSPPASHEEMVRVYGESLEICARSGTGVKVGPRCIPCQHNTVAFPDGSSFYVPLDGDLTRPV
ncbi:radical SAM protein [Candidatus Uhrbacteria bacterium]|nr:radical SAM protein [Candidatus Uhrbacteria bacterium]